MVNHLSFNMLTRVVERRAAPLEQARAERHLVGCARCRSELHWLERIRVAPGPTRDAPFGRAPIYREPSAGRPDPAHASQTESPGFLRAGG